MRPKYFMLILTFLYLISPESRDLLGFYCRASIVHSIMLLTLILTSSFSNPILEENPVGVRGSATLLSKKFCDSLRH